MACTVRYHLKNSPKAVRKILAKVTQSREQRFEVRPGEEVLLDDWDEIRQEVKRTDLDHVRKNRKLAGFKSSILSLYEEGHTFEHFKKLVQGNPDEKKSEVQLAFSDFIEQYEAEREPESVRVYNYFAKTLEPFFHLSFQDLDWTFFDKWKASTSQLSAGSRATYLACMKCFLTWCSKRKYPVNMDYTEFKVRKPEPKKLSLTIEEVSQLHGTWMSGSAAIGRAYLLFECYTGARISDIERFNPKDLKDGVWTFNRKKGSSIKQREITLDLVGDYCAKAIEILNQCGGKLPKVSRTTLRRHIREACKQAKIENWNKMTSHVGRRTFATILIPIIGLDEVADMMGIDPITAQKYYKGPSDRTIRRQRLVEAGKEITASRQVQKDEEKMKVV